VSPIEDMGADECRYFGLFHSSGVFAPLERLQVLHDGARFSFEVGPLRA
jgi:hypothetical protein